jgi:WD40 repeat protein
MHKNHLRPFAAALAAVAFLGACTLGQAQNVTSPQPVKPHLVLQRGHNPTWDGGVPGLAFSPDGRWLASGAGGEMTAEGELIIWDNQGRVWARDDNLPAIEEIAWSADSRFIVVADIQGARIYDRANARLIAKFSQDDGNDETYDGVSKARFLKDGQQVVLLKNNALLLWNWRTNTQRELLKSGSDGFGGVLSPSPDGRWLAFTCVNPSHRGVHLFSLENKGSEKLLAANYDEGLGPSKFVPKLLAWSPDSKKLAGIGYKAFALWDAKTMRLLRFEEHLNHYRTSFFALDNQGQISWRWLSDKNGFYLERRGANGKWKQIRRARNQFEGSGEDATAFTPDAKQWAFTIRFGNVVWYDGATGKVSRVVEGSSQWINSLAFSPSGDELAVGYGRRALFKSHGEVLIYNARNGALKTALSAITNQPDGETGVHHVAYSPDGRWLIANGDDIDGNYGLRFWDTANYRAAPQIVSETERIVRFVLSPDGQSFAYGGSNGEVALWKSVEDLRQGKKADWMAQITVESRGHSDLVMGLAMAPDKSLVLGGVENYPDGKLQVFDYQTGAVKQTLLTDQSVYGIAFSGDSKMFWTGSDSGTVLEWDTATLSVRRTLQASGSFCDALSLSPDERMLAASRNNEIALFSLPDGQLRHVLKGATRTINQTAWSPDGKLLAAGDEGGVVTLWNVQEGQIATTFHRLRQWRQADGLLQTRTVATTPESIVHLARESKTLVLWRVQDNLLTAKQMQQRFGLKLNDPAKVAQKLNP